MAENIKVYILNNGWLECDKNAMVSGSTQGTKSRPVVTNEWIKIPVMAVLIDHPEGKILYDTGCHPAAMEGYWPENLQEVFPSKVTLLSLPGHTPGILGVMVELEESGVMIFPQDSVYTKENYGPPARGAGIMHDSIAYYKSIEKVRKLAQKYQAQVIFAHDMEFFQTLKKAPEYYM